MQEAKREQARQEHVRHQRQAKATRRAEQEAKCSDKGIEGLEQRVGQGGMAGEEGRVPQQQLTLAQARHRLRKEGVELIQGVANQPVLQAARRGAVSPRQQAVSQIHRQEDLPRLDPAPVEEQHGCRQQQHAAIGAAMLPDVIQWVG